MLRRACVNMSSMVSKRMLGFRPLGDRILVEKHEPESKTKGGIHLPEKAQGKVLEAKVIAVGDGARNDKGDVIPMRLKVGDRVVLPQWGETKVTFDEKEYYILRESDILGVMEK